MALQHAFDFETVVPKAVVPVVRQIRPSTCPDCQYKRDCGGLDQGTMVGCFEHCLTNCDKNTCDYACPFKPSLFVNLVREVGGLETQPCRDVIPVGVTSLPPYVTTLTHEYCRTKTSDLATVAIPIESVFSMKTGYCRLSEVTAACLRSTFRLASSANVIIECIDQDITVEGFWQNERSSALIEQMANLGLLAVTVPNFSYFDNAPRTQVLYNRRRSSTIAERLSKAGIPAIIHLNALTGADWDWWYAVLADNPKLPFVAKEFGTGLRPRDRGVEALEQIDRLQQRLGRPLHPLLFSARRYLHEAAKRFSTVTVVDSHPFHLTRSRQRLTIVDGKPTITGNSTAIGEPLDDLYA